MMLGMFGQVPAQGQTLYTRSGSAASGLSYSFVVPDRVTTLGILCVGAEVARGTLGGTLIVSSGVYRAASTIGGDIGGGAGGAAGNRGLTVGLSEAGGGGAAGYSGDGGAGRSFNPGTDTQTPGTPSSGAGGGGGGGTPGYGDGGGIGVLGQGSNGTAGNPGSGGTASNYGGGSGGYASGSSPFAQQGQTAGRAVRYINNVSVTPGETLNVYLPPGDTNAAMGDTACRIIWGPGRQWPSTNTGDV
jgi:hypothetical protein